MSATAGTDSVEAPGLKVVDLGVGMAPAIATRCLVDLGCEVLRIEPSSGDPFHARYDAYASWQLGKRTKSAGEIDAAGLDALLAAADLCVVGGEDFPGLDWRHDAAGIAARHPRLVVLEITAYPAGYGGSKGPAADILVQARSGLCYEHYTDRPLLMSFEPCSYGAALQGLAGVLAALYERERSGRGQVVRTSLFEGALTYGSSFWTEATRPTPGFNFAIPKDPSPLIFRCGDGRYVHLIMGTAGSKKRLYDVLGIDDPSVDPNDSGVPRLDPAKPDMRKFFGDVDLLAPYIEKRESGELLAALWQAGMAAELVQTPGACWDDAQVEHNGIIVREADGTRHVTGFPASRRPVAAPRRPVPGTSGLPLAGLRVVDFGTFVAGPYASVILADLGADVIKVEAPARDPNRNVFRSFTTANRGKRAVMLDLKTVEGRDLARRLCLAADVVTNNFRTGVAARLGIDAGALHQLKPELVVLESAAYGASGPKAERAGFDLAFQAFCGHEYRAGGVGNVPMWNRSTMVDYTGGLMGAISILHALLLRARTGAGAELNVPLLNAGVFLLSELVQRTDKSFAGGWPLNEQQTGFHPAEQMYQAGDGWIAIAARDATAARKLVEVLGLDRTITRDRSAWSNAEAQALGAAIRRRGTRDLLDELEQAGVWAEACVQGEWQRILNDPRLVAQGTVHHSEHADFGTVREIGQLYRFSRSPSGRHTHTPLPGEHTRAILAELELDERAIEDLYQRKIVA